MNGSFLSRLDFQNHILFRSIISEFDTDIEEIQKMSKTVGVKDLSNPYPKTDCVLLFYLLAGYRRLTHALMSCCCLSTAARRS